MSDMIDEKTGGPAYPISIDMKDGSGWHAMGMTMRDWFAGQALAGLLAFHGSYGLGNGPGSCAPRAYEMADAMLKERFK